MRTLVATVGVAHEIAAREWLPGELELLTQGSHVKIGQPASRFRKLHLQIEGQRDAALEHLQSVPVQAVINVRREVPDTAIERRAGGTNLEACLLGGQDSGTQHPGEGDERREGAGMAFVAVLHVGAIPGAT